MSEDTVQSLLGSVVNAASWVLDGLEHVATDWQAIKASPAYSVLLPLATQIVTAELGGNIDPLVNVGGAVASMLDSLANQHPKISTP